MIDPAALGTLHVSPVQVKAFEENAGQTNTWTVRVESSGVFIVQRTDAAAQVDVVS